MKQATFTNRFSGAYASVHCPDFKLLNLFLSQDVKLEPGLAYDAVVRLHKPLKCTALDDANNFQSKTEECTKKK